MDKKKKDTCKTCEHWTETAPNWGACDYLPDADLIDIQCVAYDQFGVEVGTSDEFFCYHWKKRGKK